MDPATGTIISAIVNAFASIFNTITGRGRSRPPHSNEPMIAASRESDTPRWRCFDVFPKRNDATDTIRNIIKTAGERKQCLCVLGIAHSDIYGPASKFGTDLAAAMRTGAQVKLIFLDPESSAAARRTMYESDRPVGTQEEIRAKLHHTDAHRRQFPSRFDMRLTPDIPCYLCFNDEEMVVQPYLNSITGHDTIAIRVSRDSEMYRQARAHFDRIWGGHHCVLFDLGNVLIDFDHGRVGDQLAGYSKRRRKPTPTEINDYIFSNGGNASLNSKMDRGEINLATLHQQVSSEFAIEIDLASFRTIWTSVFASNLNPEAVQCLRSARVSGLDIRICSNTNLEHWNFLASLSDDLKELQNERRCFLSFELRKVKTDPGFFQHVAESTSYPAEHHVLLDDKYDNCRAAETDGMYAIYFDRRESQYSCDQLMEFLTRQRWLKRAQQGAQPDTDKPGD